MDVDDRPAMILMDWRFEHSGVYETVYLNIALLLTSLVGPRYDQISRQWSACKYINHSLQPPFRERSYLQRFGKLIRHAET